MQNALFFILMILAPGVLMAQEFSTATMHQITLGEAYVLALAKSERLAQQSEYIKQLDAAERVANSAFRPGLSFNASQSKQQGAASTTKGYFSGSYTVFSGMRDYIAVKAASARTQAAALDLARAKQEFKLNVAQAYLDLAAAQREIFIRREQLTVTGRRIAELESRAVIGRSRAGEVAAARSQLAQDKADYLDALSVERLAQQILMFMTGLDKEMAPADMEYEGEAGLEMYLHASLSRADLAAKRKALLNYGYLADIEDHNLWPTVGFSANYYALRKPMPDPVNRWDAGLALNVPLYTGGYAKARRDAAHFARRSAELDLALAERQALTEVKSAYEDLKYAILQLDSLRDALALALENARYQQEDYKLGLVTNLDVLNALNTVLQTRLALSKAGLRANWALLKLKNASGVEGK